MGSLRSSDDLGADFWNQGFKFEMFLDGLIDASLLEILGNCGSSVCFVFRI